MALTTDVVRPPESFLTFFIKMFRALSTVLVLCCFLAPQPKQERVVLVVLFVVLEASGGLVAATGVQVVPQSESNQYVRELPNGGRWESVQVSMTHTPNCKCKGQTGRVRGGFPSGAMGWSRGGFEKQATYRLRAYKRVTHDMSTKASTP